MPQFNRYDTIVVGGGSAGLCAAIQSARAGARTLLIEKNGMLGGTTTVGGVNFPGLFHAWGRQIIGGIGYDLVQRCLAETDGVFPAVHDLSLRHSRHHFLVDRFVYAALCDEALVEAGVEPLFHTLVGAIEAETDGWSLTICTKTGLNRVRAGVLIDCTGDANVTTLAGLPVRVSEEHQPATYCCHASGYDLNDLDLPAINQAFQREVEAGRMSSTDLGWNKVKPSVEHWLRAHGENSNHIHAMPARRSEDKTLLDIEGRRSILRAFRFLRRQPGLEKLRIEHLAGECGVRETAIVEGKATVTVQDYCSGRHWEDAVCNSFYPIDLHTSSGGGLRCEPLQPGVVPTIPRAALLPRGSRRFLVAGRCVSSDRLANSALRVQGTCMATGQAAGALAALSARAGTDPEEVDIAEVHQVLAANGAILPGQSRELASASASVAAG